MSSDLNIFMDMMEDDNIQFAEIVEENKPNSYYEGLGIHLLKQFKENEHYFHFLQSIVVDFKKLDKQQQKVIKETMGIRPEIITKEKIVYKEKKVKHKNSPCINICEFSGQNDWCQGCGRTRQECKQWKAMKPFDRNILLKKLQKRVPKES